MDLNFDLQMSLSRGKCLYSNNCLHFLKHAVPLLKHFTCVTYCSRHEQDCYSIANEQDRTVQNGMINEISRKIFL